jgi:transketolase C-terminal domain/subunit
MGSTEWQWANRAVFCPGDFAEAEAGVHAMIAHNGPFYYRCGYEKEPPVHAGPIPKALW